MYQSVKKSRVPLILFLVLAVDAYIVSAVILFSIPESYRALVASIAIPLDLMIVVPAFFYFLVIKRYKLAPALLLPVIALGGLFVFQVVRPENYLAFLAIAAIAFTIELVIIVHEVRRIGKVYKQARGASNDPREWFFAPAYALVPSHSVAFAIGTELMMTYYALCSWRKKPLVPPGSEAFSCHKDTGYLSVMCVFAFLLPLEIVALHVLISLWNPTVALVVTVLGVYTAIWLLGDCRATLLRPITLSTRTLTLNSGIRLSSKVPLTSIQSIGSENPGFSKAETLDIGLLFSTNMWITLCEPQEIKALFQRKKQVRAIGLSIDSVPSFKKALLESMESQDAS
ncbi:MAG: hypothetical protein FWD27_01245 [Coriobacteriia bacterium]|nr:hypothetical protein [Coriobacteriia bacterium]